MDAAPPQTRWTSTLLDNIREHSLTAVGLGLALLAVVILLIQGVTDIFSGNAPVGLDSGDPSPRPRA